MIDLSPIRTALAGPLAPLAKHKQFMLWRLESDDNGRPTKVPYAIDGHRGSSTDAARWTDAETALTYAHAWKMGVAFVFADSDPFTFIDIDHCRDGAGWSQFALDVCGQFPGAAIEVSQSGEGLHLFVTGDIPAGFTGRKGNGLECYARGRFVALTGTGAIGSAATNFGPSLAAFINSRFPAVTNSDVGPLAWTVTPIALAGNVPDDDNLLRAFLTDPPRPTIADRFAHLMPAGVRADVAVSNADLFNANVEVLTRAYPSDKGDSFDRSNAAFALALRLAKWTGKNCAQMNRMMDKAAFRRTKADQYHSSGETYMEWDLKRACAMTDDTAVRKWNAPVANADVQQQARTSFDTFMDRISAAPDIHAVRTIGNDVGFDLSIDRTLRETLALHVQRHLETLGVGKLPIKECRDIVALRAAHPAPDRQAMQRQANISLNLPEETVLFAPIMPTSEMLNDFVFISDGSNVASLQDRHLSLSLPDFRNTFAASRTVIQDKTVVHADEWLNHPARKMVLTRTFRAGAGPITNDPGGRSALNLWRPIPRGPYSVDISPFLEHINYLFGSDADAFLDWLAHIEQCPGVLPHHGWLHIADNFGTGRNWLESVICRLWRGYVAPSVDMDSLIGGGFNGSLAGRVIAVVDEIRAGAREDAYMMEGKIRNMLTEEVRYVKPKYGREYSEHNSCRWLLFSNHKNAIPMDDNDRRWYVVHLTAAPRADHVYAHLYGLLEQPAFIESIGAWLRTRDLSRFNPGARPPVTAAKLRAIAASKSDFQRMAALLVKHWPSDFIAYSDLYSVMTEDDMSSAGKRLNNAMKNALNDVGMERCEKHLYDAARQKYNVWFVRNVDKWREHQTVIAVHPEIQRMKAAVKGTGHQSLMALI